MRGGNVRFSLRSVTVTMTVAAVGMFAMMQVYRLVSANPERLAEMETQVVDNCTGFFGCGATDLLVVSTVVVVLSVAVSYIVSFYNRGASADE